MRHIRILGAGLLAVFALAAVAASAVQAETLEWGTCYETPHGSGGRFANAGCTEKAEHKQGTYLGEYEWERREPEGKVHLEPMTMEGNVKWETAAGEKIECTALG